MDLDSKAPSVMRQVRSLAAAIALTAALLGSGCVDKTTEHRVKANAFLRAGEADKALVECEEGLKLNEQDVSLLILKGKALFELDRLGEAQGSYTAALTAGKELAPVKLAEAHLGLAIIAARNKSWSEARSQFETLVKINPQNADARINLARACMQLKDMECAVQQAEEAGHLRGNSEDVLFTLGRIYVMAKKLDEAEKTFTHICEVVPKAASCPYGVALVAAQKGDKKRAFDKLGEAIQRKLPNPDKLGADPLLAPLKDDPDFQKLVEEAKGS